MTRRRKEFREAPAALPSGPAPHGAGGPSPYIIETPYVTVFYGVPETAFGDAMRSLGMTEVPAGNVTSIHVSARDATELIERAEKDGGL